MPDGLSWADELVEAAGKLCFVSWAAWNPEYPEATNPNLTKVRTNNMEYVGNIIESGHGSVFEHVNFGILFRDVSRVFTHELVRHRAGMGYSQESLRFRRLSEIRAWIPPSAEEAGLKPLFIKTIEHLEDVQKQLVAATEIDGSKAFSLKKKLTSMFRRLAPLGLATNILATGNIRAWRHILNMRASAQAEEEMQLVMPALARILKEEAPACFQDVTIDSDGTVTVANPKI